jgi:hypothetical protein
MNVRFLLLELLDRQLRVRAVSMRQWTDFDTSCDVGRAPKTLQPAGPTNGRSLGMMLTMPLGRQSMTQSARVWCTPATMQADSSTSL